MKNFTFISFLLAMITIVMISGCKKKSEDPEPEKPPLEQVATPTFSKENGTYTESLTLEIICTTENAKIYYTIDGSEPNNSASTLYSEPIVISSTTTVKAKAYKENFTASETATAEYTINYEQVAKPTFSKEDGTFSEPFSLVISCTTENAKIYYTIDGSEPNNSTSTLYSEPVEINSTTTVKAKAYKESLIESETATAEYTFIVSTPVFSPGSGTYNEEIYVTILCATVGSTIYYTTNGEDPDEESTIYETPVYISGTTTFKAIAYKEGCDHSEISTSQYVLGLGKVATPVFSLEGGSYSSQQNLEITCETPDSEIRYTLDGSDPTENSLLYQIPLILRKSLTVKAKAFKTNREPSDVASATYTIEIFCDGIINIKGSNYAITGVTKIVTPFGTSITFNTLFVCPFVKINISDSNIPTGTFNFGENNYCSGFVNCMYNNEAKDFYFNKGGSITIEYNEAQNTYTVSIPETEVATSSTGHQLTTTVSLTYQGTIQ